MRKKLRINSLQTVNIISVSKPFVSMEFKVAFGKVIRELREEKNWGQKKLGIEAELNDRFIGSIERAEKTASLDTVEALAKAFDFEPWVLLRLTQDKVNADSHSTS